MSADILDFSMHRVARYAQERGGTPQQVVLRVNLMVKFARRRVRRLGALGFQGRNAAEAFEREVPRIHSAIDRLVSRYGEAV